MPIRTPLVAALALIALAGCAGMPSTGADIAVWQEQERERLEAQGFRQCN